MMLEWGIYQTEALIFLASSFASTSPLDVITTAGFFDILTFSSSALLRSFLLTMCMLAQESTTNSPSSGFIVDAAGIVHSSESEYNVAVSSFLSLKNFLASSHASPRAHPLVEICPPSLMWNFDLKFPERRNVCLTQCRLCESYSSIWFQHSFTLPGNRCRIWRLSVLCYTTQLHFCLHPSSASCLVVLQPSSAEMSTQRRTYIPVSFYRTDIREDANTHKAIWCKYLSRSIRTADD